MYVCVCDKGSLAEDRFTMGQQPSTRLPRSPDVEEDESYSMSSHTVRNELRTFSRKQELEGEDTGTDDVSTHYVELEDTGEKVRSRHVPARHLLFGEAKRGSDARRWRARWQRPQWIVSVHSNDSQ